MAALPAFPIASEHPSLQRMQLLWQHALTQLEHNPRLSAYYTSRLRLVAQQQQLTLPRSMLARFCATCSLIHVPGFNCDVRVQLTTCSRRSRVRIGARVKSRKLAVVRNCWECGAATRQRCDADAPAEPRGAQRGARASQVPAMAAARGGGGGGGGARVPPCASAQLDLFGLGSEFIAFSSL